MAPNREMKPSDAVGASSHGDSDPKVPGGGFLIKNAGKNVLGYGVPLLAAFFCIPVIIRGLGEGKFGTLTLIWMLIGYFSIFDLGIGRSLTRFVAEKKSFHALSSLRSIVTLALGVMAILGIVWGGLTWALSPWLVIKVFRISAENAPETIRAFRALALAIPLVILVAGLRGILEAFFRFSLINWVQALVGVLTYVTPLLILPFSTRLDLIVGFLLGLRMLNLVVFVFTVNRILPFGVDHQTANFSTLWTIIRYGGWLTVASLVVTFVFNLDRILIGSMVSMEAVAYYSTPYEILSKVLILPVALSKVIFPVFSLGENVSPEETSGLYWKSLQYLFFILFPMTLIFVYFASPGLTLWVNRGFAENSSGVMQLLAIGFLFNGLSHVPAAHLQGAGKAKWTAIVYLAEVPLTLMGFLVFIPSFGVKGAGLAFLFRVMVDGLVLQWLSSKHLGLTLLHRGRNRTVFLTSLGLLGLGFLPMNLMVKTSLFVGGLATFLFLASGLVGESDRAFFRKSYQSLVQRVWSRPRIRWGK